MLGGLEKPLEQTLQEEPPPHAQVPARTQLPSHSEERAPTRYSRTPAKPSLGMVVSPLSPCSPSGETAALISSPAWCGRATQGLN